MLNFTSRTNFYICSIPTDMRKGREGLATIVREYFHRDPTAYGEAFIFYNKKYDTVNSSKCLDHNYISNIGFYAIKKS